MPLPILAAMAVGAGVGAVAGFAVYGAKVLFSKERKWSWRDAGAHAVGGLVGGGLFAPVMGGLAAMGLPAAVAYVGAGGIAWGGLWSLAQDAASWALGRRKGLASPKKYLLATAIGLAVSATLLPFASRVVGPGLNLRPHAGTTSAFLRPPSGAANLLKAEGEFLAYGAMSETASEATNTGLRSLTLAGANRGARALAADAGNGISERAFLDGSGMLGSRAATSRGDDLSAGTSSGDALSATAPAEVFELEPTRDEPGRDLPWEVRDERTEPALDAANSLHSPFGRWALRTAPLPFPLRTPRTSPARLGALERLEQDTSAH